MKRNKRLLSLLLAVVMIVGMFPLTASAEDEAAAVTHLETCVEGCTGDECECTCHDEESTHTGDCADECAVEGCECACHQAAVTSDDETTTTTTTTGTESGTTTTETATTTTETTTTTTTESTEGTTEGTTESTTEPATTPATETTEATTAPTTEPVLCEKCNATESEDGTVVHEKTCEFYVPTTAEKLIAAESVEDMYLLVLNLMQNDPSALTSLTAEEIAALRARINELDPEGDDTDTQDLLDTLAILPNAPEETEEPEIPDLIIGDYDSIIVHLDALYEEAQNLTSYDECEELYDRLFVVMAAALENDEPLITEEEMIAVNKKYSKIMDYLKEHFGYTDCATSIALYNGNDTRFTTSSSDESNSVQYSKSATKVADNEYMLTLDAFVTGEAATITKTKPADIVLVLDQSASMYAPMGASGGYNNSKTYEADDFNSNVTQYTTTQWRALFQNDPSLYEKAAQLGYFVAQSRGGGHQYCTTDHANDNTCKTKDWFVVQYLPDGDEDGYHWYFYRIPRTANPSRDSKVVDSNNNIVHEARPHKIKNIEAVSDTNFYFYKSQYGALYDAISSFGKGIVDANAGHRLAVVGFSAGVEYKKYADGSGLYINGEYKQYNSTKYYTGYDSNFATKAAGLDSFEDLYGSDTLTDSDYKTALMNADNNMVNIMASINAVKSDSWGTNHDMGLDMANKIFAQNPINSEERDRIIIMFTDGKPSPVNVPAYKNEGYSTNEASMTDSFVKFAHTAKNEYKAQIYTIWTSTLPTSESMFMRYGSSDYPNAEDYENHGDQIESSKYAYSVKSSADLMGAFGSVFEDVSNATTTELKEETVIRDIIAPSFTIPTPNINGWEDMSETEQMEELAKLIKVYESAYQGDGKFAESGETGYTEFTDAKITMSMDENGLYQVDVKNYDFSANYVTDLDSGGYRGNKLVIKIPIEVKPDFLGGNNVVTNGTSSGIYDKDGELVGSFEVPEVDINVSTITHLYTSKDIYLSQQASLPDIIKLGEYSQNEGNWKVDGINNAYVNIVYTIKEKDNPNATEITYTIPAGTSYASLTDHHWSENAQTHPVLEADTTYTVTCKVTSTNNASNTSTDTAEPVVNVYKPEITFQDSAIELGEMAKYDDDTTGTNLTETRNFVSVVWKHGDAVADSSVMGAAPTLEYTYSPEAGAFKEETEVQVTVTSKANSTSVPADMNVTTYTTFTRKACDCYPDCMHTADETFTVSNGTTSWINFVVHVKSFDLTIIKEFPENADYSIDNGQTFVFHITNKTGTSAFNKTVIIEGEGQVKITGIPVGDYTISEDTGWSWRYACDDSEQDVLASEITGGEATCTFTNTRTEEKWLDGNAHAVNSFKKLEN